MRALSLTITLVMASTAFAQAPAPAVEKLQDLYISRLDAWVATRDLKKVQSEVVENCGKMMYLRDASLGQATPKDLKETLDMRIDVCTKITVHRVEPQPECSNPGIIKIVCVDMPKTSP